MTTPSRPSRYRGRAAAAPAPASTEPVSTQETADAAEVISPPVEAAALPKQAEPSDLPRTETFATAYTQLRQGVDKLRSSDLSNIDDLVPLVEQTTAAYKVCKDRLSAVEKLVSAALGKD